MNDNGGLCLSSIFCLNYIVISLLLAADKDIATNYSYKLENYQALSPVLNRGTKLSMIMSDIKGRNERFESGLFQQCTIQPPLS